MKDIHSVKIIGETRDDAAGEAFDKVAKILGLGYPGGPAIEAAARRSALGAKRSAISFPRPMLNEVDFSFSGLKTAVLYEVMKIQKAVTRGDSPARAKGGASVTHGCSLSDKGLRSSNNRITTEQLSNNLRSQIANEFQKAIVETLVIKTIKAAQKYEVKSILLSGGVAANKFLRSEMEKAVKNLALSTENLGNNSLRSQSSDLSPQVSFHVPDFKYCTDNAAMIGVAAEIALKNQSAERGPAASGKSKNWKDIQADANLTL